MSFEIVTDSSANLPEELIRQLGIKVISLSFIIDGEEVMSYSEERETDLGEFYMAMREGKTIQTSLVNTGRFMELFEPMLKMGRDILYIGMSSALSGTYQSGAAAANALKEEYAERKITTVDSLSASLGQGLLVHHAAKMREEGRSIDETASWITENRLRMRHHFTVDDLMFLRRGGRVPAASAIIGTLLKIKPMLIMDDSGRLTVVDKVRGRRNSLKELTEQIEQHAVDIEDQLIALTHGDCPEEAAYVEELIRSRYAPRDVIVHLVDPVLGAHAGPGTMALFFMGQDRKL